MEDVPESEHLSGTFRQFGTDCEQLNSSLPQPFRKPHGYNTNTTQGLLFQIFTQSTPEIGQPRTQNPPSESRSNFKIQNVKGPTKKQTKSTSWTFRGDEQM